MYTNVIMSTILGYYVYFLICYTKASISIPETHTQNIKYFSIIPSI